MNTKMHGLVQTEWRWLIAIYLWLAGAGGGAFLTGIYASYAGWEGVAKIGSVLSWPLVGIGCALLLLDLGKMQNAWRVWMKPGTSWMARGTIIISLFMILGFIHSLLIVLGVFAPGDPAALALAIVTGIFAFATMVYTGLLLGDAIPFPFWNTVLLPILFFMSALSTGVMLVILGGSVAKMGGLMAVGEENLHFLASVDVAFILAEAGVLAAYLYGAYRLPISRHSAHWALMGDGAAMFWGGVAVCGLALPLIIDVIPGLPLAAAALAALLGLLGGLFLRMVVLSGGAHYPMYVNSWAFKPVSVPKLPKPDRGMVPPGNI